MTCIFAFMLTFFLIVSILLAVRLNMNLHRLLHLLKSTESSICYSLLVREVAAVCLLSLHQGNTGCLPLCCFFYSNILPFCYPKTIIHKCVFSLHEHRYCQYNISFVSSVNSQHIHQICINSAKYNWIVYFCLSETFENYSAPLVITFETVIVIHPVVKNNL